MAIELVFDIVDNDGDVASTSIKVDDFADTDQVNSSAGGFAQLLDAVILGAIVAAQAIFEVDLSGVIRPGPGLVSDVEELGKFLFATAIGTKAEVNMPTLNEAFVIPSSDSLDEADPLLAAFIDAMESGIAVTGGTISPCDIGEGDIISTVYAREGARASGKAR